MRRIEPRPRIGNSSPTDSARANLVNQASHWRFPLGSHRGGYVPSDALEAASSPDSRAQGWGQQGAHSWGGWFLCMRLGISAAHLGSMRVLPAPESLVAAALASGRAMPVKTRETLMLKRCLVNSVQRFELIDCR